VRAVRSAPAAAAARSSDARRDWWERVEQPVRPRQPAGNGIAPRWWYRRAHRVDAQLAGVRDPSADLAPGGVGERLPTRLVSEEHPWPVVAAGIPGAPGAEGVQGGPQRPAGRGELVQHSARMLRVGSPLQHARVDQTL